MARESGLSDIRTLIRAGKADIKATAAICKKRSKKGPQERLDNLAVAD